MFFEIFLNITVAVIVIKKNKKNVFRVKKKNTNKKSVKRAPPRSFYSNWGFFLSLSFSNVGGEKKALHFPISHSTLSSQPVSLHPTSPVSPQSS